MPNTPGILLPLFLLCAPFAVHAVDYDYVDGMLVSQDGPRDDYTGLGLRAAFPISPQLHVAGELLSTDAGNGIDIDRFDMALGAGYHMPLNRTTDFVAQIDFLRVDTDVGDDDGLRLGAGVRSQVAKQIELRGFVQYVDVFDGELVVNLGAQYAISSAWAGFLELSEGDEFGGYLMGARFDF